MKAYRLSGQADRQLDEMHSYSEQQFGPALADKYLRGFAAVFDLLAANSLMGRSADQIRPGLRRHEHGAHVIFYRDIPEGILIVTLLHRRMLPNPDLDVFDA